MAALLTKSVNWITLIQLLSSGFIGVFVLDNWGWVEVGSIALPLGLVGIFVSLAYYLWYPSSRIYQRSGILGVMSVYWLVGVVFMFAATPLLFFSELAAVVSFAMGLFIYSLVCLNARLGIIT